MAPIHADQQRRIVALTAFQRLAENKPLLKQDIFKDPNSGYYQNSAWHRRFLIYLESKSIIHRPASSMGRNVLYQLVQPPSEASAAYLDRLLSDPLVLNKVLFTNFDPLENGVEMQESEESEETSDEQDDEEELEENEETVEEEEPTGAIDPLGIIAERLVDVIEVLSDLKGQIEAQTAAAYRQEQYLLRALKEMGIDVLKEEG